MSIIRRGLAAGAAGTTFLNAATYLDMAVRGRDASSVPEQTVEALADTLGATIPGKGSARANRVTGYGALSGTATGLAVGLAASVARASGLRLPAPVAAVATGAAAMAASDGATAGFGISDPRTWTTEDWLADALPHLAFGVATQAVLRATEPPPEGPEPTRPSAGLIGRSLLLGAASGSRASLGFAGPAISTAAGGALTGGFASVSGLLLIGGELVGDKLPSTPSRLAPQGFASRFTSSTVGALALARRENATVGLPVLAGLLGAAAGLWGGAAWRSWAGGKGPDWQGAVVEDAVAVSLAAIACLPQRSAARRRSGVVVV